MSEQSEPKGGTIWSLLKQVHEDRRGGVSVETVLIIAAIALPILIFLGKYAWPRVKGIFISGLDDLEGAAEDGAVGP